MLSLTLAVRAPDGSSWVHESSTQEQFPLQIWASVSDQNNDPASDSVQEVVFQLADSYSFGTISDVQPAAEFHFGSASDLPNAASENPVIDAAAATPITSENGGEIVDGELQVLLATATYSPSTLDLSEGNSISAAPYDADGTEVIYQESNHQIVFPDPIDPDYPSPVVVSPLDISTDITPPAPTAQPINATAKYQTAVDVNVLFPDTFPSTPLATHDVAVSTLPANGTAVVQPDGSVVYTPAAGFFGNDSFEYAVTDADGNVSQPGKVSIDVWPLPPVASDMTLQTTLGRVVSAAIPGTTLTETLTLTQPSNGKAAGGPYYPGQVLGYVPNSNFVGSDSFTYSLTDGDGQVSNTGTVTVLVGMETSVALYEQNQYDQAHPYNGPEPTGTIMTDGVPDPTASLAEGQVVTGRSISFNNNQDRIIVHKGTATVYFSGNATYTDAGAAGLQVSGTGLQVSEIDLGNTTATDTLQIKSADSDLTVGAISNSEPLGTILAPGVTLSGAVSLAAVGTLSVGQLQGANLSATSLRSLRVAGGIDGSQISVANGATSVSAASVSNSGFAFARTLTAFRTGELTDTTIMAGGDIGNLIADDMDGDLIAAGAAPTTLPSYTGADIGRASIDSVRLTSRSGDAFVDTTIAAHAIGVAALGVVETENQGTANGLAAAAIRSASFDADGVAYRLDSARLTTPAVFADFEIELVS